MIPEQFDQLKAYVEQPGFALLNRDAFFSQAKTYIESQGIEWQQQAEHDLYLLLELLQQASPVFH